MRSNTYRVMFNCYIVPDTLWSEGEARELPPLDALALNYVYWGLLQPIAQMEPELAFPSPGTPEHAAMQRRAHELTHPARPITAADHQAVRGGAPRSYGDSAG
jgi:hypothetical protein